MPATGVLRQAIGGQRRRVAQATLLLVTHQAAEALVPVAAGAVIDAAVATGDAGALLRWIVLLAVLFAVLSNAYRLGARRGEAAVEYAAHDLRLAVAGGSSIRAGAPTPAACRASC
jgi:putative ABC transport system ATP-binding protein